MSDISGFLFLPLHMARACAGADHGRGLFTNSYFLWQNQPERRHHLGPDHDTVGRGIAAQMGEKDMVVLINQSWVKTATLWGASCTV